MSPSGYLVAYCSGDVIGILDLRSGRTRILPYRHAPNTGWTVHMGWTSDGKLLLLDLSKLGGWLHRVYELHDKSMVERYATDHWIYGPPIVSLAGGALAFAQSKSANTADTPVEMAVVEAHGGRQRLLKILPNASSLAAFDDGNQLLYRNGLPPASVEILRRRGDTFVRRPTQIAGDFGWAVVGPDGRIALAGSSTGRSDNVYILDPVSLEVRRIARGGGPLAWAPDGSILYSVYSSYSQDHSQIRAVNMQGRSRLLVSGQSLHALTVLPR